MVDFNADLTPSETSGVDSNYIPASTPQVHASNILRLPSGDLLCAWFGGSQEGLSDICVRYFDSLVFGTANVWLTHVAVADSLLAPS